MSTNIEDKVETAWIAAVDALTSYPVYKWEDVSHQRPQSCVVVQVMPFKNENSSAGIPDSPMFVGTVEITAASLIVKDKDKAILKTIFQSISEAVRNNTKATMTTFANGLNFSGWTMQDGDQGKDNDCFYRTLKIECHVET